MAFIINIKSKFSIGVQDIALVISAGITCFFQVVRALRQICKRDCAVRSR